LIWSGVRIEADLAGRARRSQETKPDDARKRIAALTRRAADLPAETTRARSYRQLVDTEQARAAGAEADWPAAVAAWRTAGEPHMLAYALMRLAAALVATGNREEATRAADEAARHARALGAQPLLSEVLDLGRRARLGVEARGGPEAAELDGPLASYGLTDREREVLQLVADGRSNSEIGAALFITRKTASVHVSNILAKIGVASRGEAAALVHRLGGALLGTGPLP
jgi:DNA-binding CsgD family transcriptional regulator